MKIKDSVILPAVLATALVVKEAIIPGEIAHATKNISREITHSIESKIRGDVQRTIKVPQGITNTVDSLFITTRDVSRNNGNCFWGDDTIKIPNDIKTNPASFIKKLLQRADSKVPEAISKERLSIIPLRLGKSKFPLISKQTTYAPKYINNQALIDNKILTNKNSELYLHVEYYGKENPAIKK